ncbi:MULTISPECIES: hypothetical protein [unclassified Streptomyces]|uniref:hypothetical protein n=1 Tax=unclassified Streptomyces TaxID=2593676 RepID=UPI00109E5065|nr:hypothetical protein [Streptomyces sp. A1136]THA46760.1 hypothetical protein E6R62_32925 [Streptomyces sp. A1136]
MGDEPVLSSWRVIGLHTELATIGVSAVILASSAIGMKLSSPTVSKWAAPPGRGNPSGRA